MALAETVILIRNRNIRPASVLFVFIPLLWGRTLRTLA
jgi:hypothetical protein